MIVYGVITEESIIDLFLAGIGPRIMLASVLVIYLLPDIALYIPFKL